MPVEILVTNIRSLSLELQRQRAGVSHLEKLIPMLRSRIIITAALMAFFPVAASLAMPVMIVSSGLSYMLFLCLGCAIIVQIRNLRRKMKRLEQSRLDLALNEARFQALLEELPREEHEKLKDVLEVTSPQGHAQAAHK